MNIINDTAEYTTAEPRKFQNYALLHSHGLAGIFDFMRYEQAFLVRHLDCEALLASATPERDFVSRPFSLLVCKPDFKSVTKPGWVANRLRSEQKLEPISRMDTLWELNIGVPQFNISKPLSWLTTGEVTGALPYILDIMLTNQAFPNEESDSHRIEDAFENPMTPITVKLKRFANGLSDEWI